MATLSLSFTPDSPKSPMSSGPPVSRGSLWSRIKGSELTPETILSAPSLFMKAIRQIPSDEVDSDEARKFISCFMDAGLLNSHKVYDLVVECAKDNNEELAQALTEAYVASVAADNSEAPPRTVEKCKQLDAVSVLNLSNGSGQFMVYGWEHCKYHQVASVLSSMSRGWRDDHDFPVAKIFISKAGDPSADTRECTTCEGRNIRQIDWDQQNATSLQLTSRTCKTGITNLVRENLLREAEGLPIIPCLFCSDIDGNPYPLEPDDIADRGSVIHNFITTKELRRVWKLCHHENAMIQRVAKETFQFVKLKRTSREFYALIPQPSPVLDNDRLDALMAARKEDASKTKVAKSDDVNWDKQLTRVAEELEAQTLETSLSETS